MTSPSTAPSSDLQALVPKLVTVLRDGYSGHAFCADGFGALVRGGTLIPVVLALTVDANISPVRGMVSAGVAVCIAAHGDSGLAVATLMAGALLILAAGARWPTWIRYVPNTGTEAIEDLVCRCHRQGTALILVA